MRTPSLTNILALIAGLAVAAGAGPIDPPAGSVASTMKPLDQIEPRIAVNAQNTPGDDDGTPSLFKISQPGSYYLVGNVTGVGGKTGIEIAADGVTLDLAGFVLQGVVGAQHGIQVTGEADGFTITNGMVRDWPGSGVMSSPSARGARIVGVTARDNAGHGFVTPKSSAIESCIATGNGQVGFYLGEGSSASLCTAAENSTSGFQGIAGVQLSGCAANDNDGWGIISGPGSAVRSCTAARNGYIGIEVTNINASTGGVVEGSSAFANGGWGILAGYGTLVSGCTAADNTDDGIYATTGCTVSDCTVYNNDGDGIEAQSDCTIVRNQVRGHGASGKAGIYAWSTACRIEENNLTSNAYGLRVTGTDNFIARNTARANTSGNYSISSGNELAPVITNPGQNGFSTMTPWSNVAY